MEIPKDLKARYAERDAKNAKAQAEALEKLEKIHKEREESLKNLQGLERITFLVEENNKLADMLGQKDFRKEVEEVIKKSGDKVVDFLNNRIEILENLWVVSFNQKVVLSGESLSKYPKEERDRIRKEWDERDEREYQNFKLIQKQIEESRRERVKMLSAMTEEERKSIDLVVNTFGMYGGKVLEKITHNEEPWKNARRGYADHIPSSEMLTKDSIQKYYETVDMKYGIETEQGLMNYIQDMLK